MFIVTLRIYCEADPATKYLNIDFITAQRSNSRYLTVTSVLTLLSFTIFGLVIIQWYLTSISFSGAPANRLEVFAMSGGPGPNAVVSVLGQILQGVGQILADALLVCIPFLVLDTETQIDRTLRCGVVGTS